MCKPSVYSCLSPDDSCHCSLRSRHAAECVTSSPSSEAGWLSSEVHLDVSGTMDGIVVRIATPEIANNYGYRVHHLISPPLLQHTHAQPKHTRTRTLRGVAFLTGLCNSRRAKHIRIGVPENQTPPLMMVFIMIMIISMHDIRLSVRELAAPWLTWWRPCSNKWRASWESEFGGNPASPPTETTKRPVAIVFTPEVGGEGWLGNNNKGLTRYIHQQEGEGGGFSWGESTVWGGGDSLLCFLFEI